MGKRACVVARDAFACTAHLTYQNERMRMSSAFDTMRQVLSYLVWRLSKKVRQPRCCSRPH